MSLDRRLYMSLSPLLNKIGDSVFPRGMGRAERDGQSTSRISRRTFPLDLFSTHLIGLQEVNQARRMVDGELEVRSLHVSIKPRK